MARFDDNGDGKLDLEEFQRWSNTMSIGILPFYFAIAQIHGSKEKGWTERKSEWRGEKGKSWGECSSQTRKHHQDSDWGKEGVAGPQIFWLLVSADQGSLDICSAVDNKLLLAFLIWYGGNYLVAALRCKSNCTFHKTKVRTQNTPKYSFSSFNKKANQGANHILNTCYWFHCSNNNKTFGKST